MNLGGGGWYTFQPITETYVILRYFLEKKFHLMKWFHNSLINHNLQSEKYYAKETAGIVQFIHTIVEWERTFFLLSKFQYKLSIIPHFFFITVMFSCNTLVENSFTVKKMKNLFLLHNPHVQVLRKDMAKCHFSKYLFTNSIVSSFWRLSYRQRWNYHIICTTEYGSPHVASGHMKYVLLEELNCLIFFN